MNVLTDNSLVDAAFERVRKATPVMTNQIVIWGGSFDAARLDEFLTTWDPLLKRLRWRMYEYVDTFQARQATADDARLPTRADHYKLERARFFSESGDLDLRRDSDSFYWRFIGEPHDALDALKQKLPEVEFVLADYWQEHPGDEFRRIKHKYYQWRGKDERVASRWLLDIDLGGEDVYLNQWQYLKDGRIEFVRFVGFASGD